MTPFKTRKEQVSSTVEEVSLLTYVLSYDDLCARRSASWILGDGALDLSRGRPGTGTQRPSAHRIEVDDDLVSGVHATIRRSGPVHIVVDRKSTNGTFVNGSRVEEIELSDGDLVEVGHSLFCYHIAPTPFARALEESRLVRFGATDTRSWKVSDLAHQIHRLAPTRLPVLIIGATGAGKEGTARMIHDLSGRVGAFKPLHCGAISATLFESEFFGHERGAFTDAKKARRGALRDADGGTVFLDELATMPQETQPKLLRAIETGQITPVGGDPSEQIDLRWVAATNEALDCEEIREVKQFRSDLFARLSNQVLHLPLLRERREDLGTLTAHILSEAKVVRAAIAPDAARSLFAGRLPLNIRELHRLAAAAAVAAPGPILRKHLPLASSVSAPNLRAEKAPPAKSDPSPPAAPSPKQKLRREDVIRTLNEAQGNVAEAARRLDTYAKKIRRFADDNDIELASFRSRGEGDDER